MADVGHLAKMPRRLRYKLVSNGERVKLFFEEDVGGSYLTPAKVVDEVLHSGRLEGYADFVEDSAEWRGRRFVGFLSVLTLWLLLFCLLR